MTPHDVIAGWLDELPLALSWRDLPAETYVSTSADRAISALEAAGYRIVPQTALNELEQEARNGDCSYHFGWIVGWLDKHAPDLPARTAQEAK